MIHLFFIRPNIYPIRSETTWQIDAIQYTVYGTEIYKKKKHYRPKFVGITWENIARRLLQIKKKKTMMNF